MTQSMRGKYPSNVYPFSDELCIFMDAHPEFHQSLKLANPNRFKFIPRILLSHTPNGHPLSNDQVIGLLYYDVNEGIFKQDYIVNKGNNNNYFISFSADKSDGDYVKPIAKFFEQYGNEGQFYHRNARLSWEHHYHGIAELPDDEEFKEMAFIISNDSRMKSE